MAAVERTCDTLPSAETLQSIVRVDSGGGVKASGVIVDIDRVLTVAHIIDSPGTIEIGIRNALRPADVLAVDPAADLALLSVNTGTIRPVPMSFKNLSKTEQVWAVGYPLARRQQTTHGFFQGTERGRLYTTATIDSGSSGGGLFRCRDGTFELAGIVRGYLAYRRGSQYVNSGDSTSVSASRIKLFLESLKGI